MITIVVIHEDDQSDEFDFDPSKSTISIGRRSSNDVCIPNLSVSGRHARIVFNEGEAWVEDLNSTNGTYIKNRLISRQMLNHGDELVVGKTRVRFENAAAGSTIHADAKSIDQQAHSGNQSAARPAKDETADDSLFNDSPPKELAQEPAEHSHPTTAAARAASNNFETESFDDSSSHLDNLDASSANGRVGSDNEVASNSQSAHSYDEVSAIDDLDELPAQVAQKASSSEALFESLADDLSNREPESTRAGEQDLSFLDDDSDDDFDHSSADDAPMTLSEKAKLALGRSTPARPSPVRPSALAEDVATAEPKVAQAEARQRPAPTQATPETRAGAVIEIKNGAKSGQVLPIDKPVTTLGRPGLQIAAIMRKPDGYFLMHIESVDSIAPPTLNNDAIGDEPLLLQSGDELNVAGIDVEFSLA